MVSRKEYERKTESYWKTVTVKTTRDLHNGFVKVPAGTLCQIHAKRGGFTLTTKPCEHCGVFVYITRVEPEAVQVVSVDGKPFSMGV